MKAIWKYVPLSAALALLMSCAPVLDRRYMTEGEREVSFQALRENTDQYKGTLYVLGGVIVRTKFAETGPQIEAMQVPVDRYGYFEDEGRSEGRFLAVSPKGAGTPDPVMYHRGRRVTLAGEFVEIRKGKIDEMEYAYPVFLIKQVYLWPKERRNYPPQYYYDPWFQPYPYVYGYPWWRYPYYYTHKPVPSPSPIPSPKPRPRKERGPEHERERERK
jgi:outer membrane lipoprotein